MCSIAPGDVGRSSQGIMTTDAPVDTADVIAAYWQIIERAHAHGVAVFDATLTPYGGSGSSTANTTSFVTVTCSPSCASRYSSSHSPSVSAAARHPGSTCPETSKRNEQLAS